MERQNHYREGIIMAENEEKIITPEKAKQWEYAAKKPFNNPNPQQLFGTFMQNITNGTYSVAPEALKSLETMVSDDFFKDMSELDSDFKNIVDAFKNKIEELKKEAQEKEQEQKNKNDQENEQPNTGDTPQNNEEVVDVGGPFGQDTQSSNEEGWERLKVPVIMSTTANTLPQITTKGYTFDEKTKIYSHKDNNGETKTVSFEKKGNAFRIVAKDGQGKRRDPTAEEIKDYCSVIVTNTVGIQFIRINPDAYKGDALKILVQELEKAGKTISNIEAVKEKIDRETTQSQNDNPQQQQQQQQQPQQQYDSTGGGGDPKKQSNDKRQSTDSQQKQTEDAQITKDDLIKALDGVEYDKSVVLDMIDKHPDMVKTLIDAKDKEGKPLFDALNIDSVLFNCKDIIEKHPDKIIAVLNNPEEIAIISEWSSHGAGLWRAVSEPLNSTVERNPEVFPEEFAAYIGPEPEKPRSVFQILKESYRELRTEDKMTKGLWKACLKTVGNTTTRAWYNHEPGVAGWCPRDKQLTLLDDLKNGEKTKNTYNKYYKLYEADTKAQMAFLKTITDPEKKKALEIDRNSLSFYSGKLNLEQKSKAGAVVAALAIIRKYEEFQKTAGPLSLDNIQKNFIDHLRKNDPDTYKQLIESTMRKGVEDHLDHRHESKNFLKRMWDRCKAKWKEDSSKRDKYNEWKKRKKKAEKEAEREQKRKKKEAKKQKALETKKQRAIERLEKKQEKLAGKGSLSKRKIRRFLYLQGRINDWKGNGERRSRREVRQEARSDYKEDANNALKNADKIRDEALERARNRNKGR